MALDKQIVSIPLTQGIDSKTDPKAVKLGKLLSLKNAIFQTPQSIRKRNGYVQLGAALAAASGTALATFDNQLVALDGKSLYTYSETTSSWANRGNQATVNFTVTPVIRNNYQQVSQDMAMHSNGIKVFTWEDSSGGCRFSVIDGKTGSTLLGNQLLAGSASSIYRPKPLVLGNYIVILYCQGAVPNNRISYVKIDVTNPTVVSGPTTLVSDVNGSTLGNSSNLFDATVVGNRIFVAYVNNSLSVAVCYLDSSFSVSSIAAMAGENPYNAVSIFGDPVSQNIWVAYNYNYFGATDVKAFVKDYNLSTTVLAPKYIESVNSVYNVTGIVQNGVANFFYGVRFGKNYNAYVRTRTCTVTGTLGSAVDYCRSVGLAGKPFLYNSTIYVPLVHDSDLQPTYFISYPNPNATSGPTAVVAAKIAPQNGGGLTAKSLLPETINTGSGKFSLALLQKDLLTSVNGTIYTQTGVIEAALNFSPSNVDTAFLGNNLHIAGGYLSMFDGGSVVEHGFHFYPEYLASSVPLANAKTPTYFGLGGALSKGQYQYVAVYEWTDGSGQVHRSAPTADALTVKIDDSQTGFYGTTTAGSNQMTGVSLPNALYANLMPISGPGLPSGTTIIGINTSTFNVSLSQNATASVSGYYTATPVIYPNITAASPRDNTFTIAGSWQNLQTMACTVSGSNQIVVPDATYLVPGMVVTSKFGEIPGSVSSSPTTITAINGNVLTLSANALVTAANVYIQIFFALNCTATAGSGLYTNVDPNLIPYIKAGRMCSFGNLPNSTPYANVISASGTTVSITGAAQTSGSTILYIHFPTDALLKVGSVLSGPGVSSCTVKSIVDSGTNATVTVDNLPTTAQVGMGSLYSVLNNYAASISIDTLRVTQKTGGYPAQIVLYRTAANGTVFYRLNPPTQPLINDPTVDSLTYFDLIGDGVLIGNAQLYTTGGEVENIGAPAFEYLADYKNRLLGIPSENTTSFWFSKQVIPGSPVEFSDVFVWNVTQKGGKLTALAQMDDKLILLKSSIILAMAGDGPSSNSQNDDFTEAQLICADVGCTDPKSVILTPNGLMFKGLKGFYLLDRSLQTHYIGAAVEAFNGASVTSAQLIPQTTQIRFSLAGTDKYALVYDYFVNEWSIFTNHSVADACTYKDLYTYLSPDGKVMQETPGQFTDNGSFVPLSLTTSWISMAGLQGFQRIWRFLVLGEYKSPHSLNVGIAYDFDSAITQTDSVLVASSPGVYQYRIHLARQKCEAIQISLSDSQSTPFGEGLSLTALGLEVGIKRGLNKLGSSKSSG